MEVEILMATYNGEKFLKEQLESLLKQTHNNWKLVISDDNSTDNTVKIAEAFQQKLPGRITLFKNKGLGATLNFSFLLSKASAPYIMLCDQDDVWLPEKIGRSLQEMKSMEAKYGAQTPLLVFTDVKIVDEALNVLQPSFWEMRKTSPSIALSLEKLIGQNVITGCTVLLNTSAARIASPIPTVLFQHDHWLGIQVANKGKISYLSEPTMLYRQHSSNAVGGSSPTIRYFLRRIMFVHFLVRSWLFLKRTGMRFSIWRVIWYKFRINVSRMVKIGMARGRFASNKP